MENINQNNKITENDPTVAEYDFKYNFISVPWDDRSQSSKIGIIALLVTIFLAIIASVIINFVVHYRGYYYNIVTNSEIKCHFVKMEDHRFVARIHSTSTNELLCVGAVVSTTSVLANGVCVKSRSTRLRMGSLTDPRCKKGFPVDIIEPVYHDGVVLKNLVLLSTFENMADCGSIIRIGKELDLKSHAYIFGRPLRLGKTLSRQPATFMESRKPNTLKFVKTLNNKNTICVKGLVRCPVRAGDLLVQNNKLYGLASTSVHHSDKSKIACFADIKVVQKELEDLDSEIKIDEYNTSDIYK